MKKTIYYAVFLAVTAMLVTAVAYVGFHLTQPVIEANTTAKINANIALLFDPAQGYERDPNQTENMYLQDSPAYKQIQDIYRVLDKDGNLYSLIYDMKVQGRNDFIYALVAIDPTTGDIQGLTYYQQSETPNIGEKYMREENYSKLIGQNIENVQIDAFAGATTTWNALNVMYDAIKTHYNAEVK